MTSLWRGSNREALYPNPLSYYPQLGLSITSQRMVMPHSVRSRAWLL